MSTADCDSKPAIGPGSASPPGNREELLQRMLSNPRLPTPPTVALQIIQKSRQENCNVQEVGNLLARDPALCGKLLKTLNSSAYALSQPVTSLTRAVTVLGLRGLRSLVLGLALPSMQMRVKPDQGLRNYWLQSVAGAIMARELGRHFKSPWPEDDLVASLLRDLGMVLLNQTFPEDYRPIWDDTGVLRAAVQCEWEERHLGINHAEASAALLSSWGLPAEIVEPVRFHHYPELMPEAVKKFQTRARLLCLTSLLAHLSEVRPGSDHFHRILDLAHMQFGMKRSELEDFLNTVRPKIEEFAAIINIDIGTCPDFAAELAAGCEELVRISIEVAEETMSGTGRSAGPGPLDPGANDQPIGAEDLFKTRDSRARSVTRFSDSFFRSLAHGRGPVRIQQYQTEALLGRGAMGIVIKALDLGLNRPVALKILSPELVDSEEALKRFALEARFASAIRQENVVSIYSVGELDGVPFLVMEYVDGGSLQERLDRGERFPVAQIVRLGRQIALGLAAAHNQRLIHRDIKPANVLIDAASQSARITDFGLVRVLDQDLNLTANGSMVGTPLFMSPEQVDGEPLTPSTDLFSLGSLLYMLCTGQTPFVAETMLGLLRAIVQQAPTPIRDLNPAIPEGLCQAIERLHAKEPEDRFASAQDLAKHLEGFVERN